jgi:3-oxoacyl-[acyl-carrier protein] reductase
VTGGSSGIGAAVAELLAELGAQVSVGYTATGRAPRILRTDHRSRRKGRNIKADMRRTSEVRALVAKRRARWADRCTRQQRRLAGQARPPGGNDREIWDEVFALNLKSAAFMPGSRPIHGRAEDRDHHQRRIHCRPEWRRARRGGVRGGEGGSDVADRSWAKELAQRGSASTRSRQSVIATPFHETFSTAEMSKTLSAQFLSVEWTPKECATVIAFLASEAASYLIGETIEINGGCWCSNTGNHLT